VVPVFFKQEGKPVDDLSIGRPDLESLFRRFYERAEP